MKILKKIRRFVSGVLTSVKDFIFRQLYRMSFATREWKIYNKGSEPKPMPWERRIYFKHKLSDGTDLELVMLIHKVAK